MDKKTEVIFIAIPMAQPDMAQSLHNDPQVIDSAFDAGAVTLGPDGQYYYARLKNGGQWPPLDLEAHEDLGGHRLHSYCDGFFGIWYTNNIEAT